VLLLILLLLGKYANASITIILNIIMAFIICQTLISLLVSSYVYDFSKLYKLSWLNNFINNDDKRIVNIHAGFDETSSLLKSKYADAKLYVFDFYNPQKHTEVSIKRARKAFPPFPGTKEIETGYLPLDDDSADKIFAILSAHEIRNDKERAIFFKELHRVVTAKGALIVTEHLRDVNNFLAYNIGAFHFHSRKSWLSTFRNAGLTLYYEIKITPFITTFILNKNGVTF